MHLGRAPERPREPPIRVRAWFPASHSSDLRHHTPQIRPQVTGRKPHDGHAPRQHETVARAIALERFPPLMKLPTVNLNRYLIVDHQIHPPHPRDHHLSLHTEARHHEGSPRKGLQRRFSRARRHAAHPRAAPRDAATKVSEVSRQQHSPTQRGVHQHQLLHGSGAPGSLIDRLRDRNPETLRIRTKATVQHHATTFAHIASRRGPIRGDHQMWSVIRAPQREPPMRARRHASHLSPEHARHRHLGRRPRKGIGAAPHRDHSSDSHLAPECAFWHSRCPEVLVPRRAAKLVECAHEVHMVRLP